MIWISCILTHYKKEVDNKMKNIIKKFIGIIIAFSMLTFVASCFEGERNITPPDDKANNEIELYPIAYLDVNQEDDMEKFWAQTRKDNGKGGTVSHDDAHDYGFVDSVWHTLKINQTDVAVYSTRCGFDIHSFAWIDILVNGEFEIDIELSLMQGDKTTCVVLPKKSQVNAQLENNVVRATLTEYGSYSFTFDESPEMALTLYVGQKLDFEIPEGYSLEYLEPDTYTAEQTTFSESNKVYYFKSGNYDVTSIGLPSNSVMYMESGAYFRVYQDGIGDYSAALYNTGTENIKVMGRGIFDFSKCIGGDAKTKGVFSFSRCQNIDFSGVVSINSNNWTLCFWYCQNVKVSQCMIFGYRTYSDGVMFSDCQDSYASDCFVRTGDDGMEVKSFTASTDENCSTKNVVFENNNVWTDKGIAYGCIYESVHDVEDVYFKNNAVGFAQSAWSDHLGVCVIQMGSSKASTWQNIYFENIEAYKINCSLLSVFNRANNDNEGGLIKNIYFKNVSAKHIEQTNLPLYALNIVIKINNNAPSTNSRIGRLYLDNIDYAGILITDENINEHLNCNISEGAAFTTNNIKINTLV